MLLATRAAFLPPTLCDIDSVNFALALTHFDPALHQPHPPGYPVFVAFARLVHVFVPEPVRALSLVSVISQAACLLPLVIVLQELGAAPAVVASGAVLTLFAPVVWFNGTRPMSDSFGLMLTLWAQAMLLRAARDGRGLRAGSVLAGLVPGARLQAAVLVAPLWWRAWRRRPEVGAVLALAASAGAWILALVLASRGHSAYAQSFEGTMSTALTNEPLWTTPTLRNLVMSALHVVVGPWAWWPLAAAVSVIAVLGLWSVGHARPADLRLGLLAFLPYIAFHVLVHRVEAHRYTMLYVPVVAWLAAEGLGWLSSRRAWSAPILPAATVAFAGVATAVTWPALVEYHRTPAPPYAALRAAGEAAQPPGSSVLAAHYMYQRYLDQAPRDVKVLPTIPREEMRSLRDYWQGGGRQGVLFMGEPNRTDLSSVDPASRRLLGRWSRGPVLASFMSAERPNAVELQRLDPPRWFAGDGWQLSLEGGRPEVVAARAERHAFLAPLARPAFLLVSGEPLSPDGAGAAMELRLDGARVGTAPCDRPLGAEYAIAPGGVSGQYRPLDIVTSRAGTPAPVPFVLRGLDYGDLDSPGLVLADGWHYVERDDHTAEEFRWASPRARVILHVPAAGARLRLEGTAPLRRLGGALVVRIRVDGAVASELRVTTDGRFTTEVALPAGAPGVHAVVIESDQSFVPARVQRNGDERVLSFRGYVVRLVPLAAPPRG